VLPSANRENYPDWRLRLPIFARTETPRFARRAGRGADWDESQRCAGCQERRLGPAVESASFTEAGL